MGRSAVWTPRRITTADRLCGEIIRATYTAKKNDKIEKAYREFCAINGLSAEAGLVPWIGQMHESGLSAGTIDTYLQQVVKSTPSICRSSEAHVVLSAVAAFHSHVGGRGHAPNLTQVEANRILAECERIAPLLAHHLWALMVTGLRPSCLSRIEKNDFEMTRKFNQAHLLCRIRLAKGIRKTRKRREVEFPLQGIRVAPRGFKKALRNATFPLASTPAKLNKVLSDACSNLKVKRITCGSFRRLYCQRIKPYCKRHNLTLSSMLLHASEDMARAHYDFDAR